MVSFVLCEGLEADVYSIRLIDAAWTVVDKVKDMHIPSSTTEFKHGGIRDLLEALSEFEERCIIVNEISRGSQRRKTSMQRIYNKQPSAAKFLRQTERTINDSSTYQSKITVFKLHLKLFWNAIMLLQAHTVWCRVLNVKIPTISYLYRIQTVKSAQCRLCQK
ncbi:hypothetical protein G6F37_004285 [Rhizopus arrhizus]|nr:hypothetical protein G6F37_004285 [Rhizopus arrhizus]